jgi:tetratricopeptide (TPR) repeat protein
LFRRYREQGYDEVTSGLERVRDWVKFSSDVDRAVAGGPIEMGAAFSLEAGRQAAAGLGRNFTTLEFKAAAQLLRSALHRLRDRKTASAFDARWVLAAFALVQGMGRDGPVLAAFGDLNEYAVRRFPGHAEVRLAAIMHDEQELIAWHLWQGVEVARADSQSEADALRVARQKMGEVAERYRQLAPDPGVGPEARLRAGAMQLMRREFNLALSDFGSLAAPSTDPWVAYLARLFEGHALAELGRRPDAITAYRRALAIIPAASSAQVALAAVLYAADTPAEAADLVRAMLTNDADNDPWPWYHYGEFRRLNDRIRAMREALR